MTIIEETDPRLHFVPIEDAIFPPPGLIEHLKDRWWIIHPSRGLVFWKPHPREDFHAPQCNSNKAVTEHLGEKMYPWAEVRFLPSVFRKIRPQDYV